MNQPPNPFDEANGPIVSIITTQQLEMLLPLVCGWAVGQERAIVQSGVALSESQLADARRVGVAQPERVRLLRVAQIPVPTARTLAAAARATNLITPSYAWSDLPLWHFYSVRLLESTPAPCTSACPHLTV